MSARPVTRLRWPEFAVTGKPAWIKAGYAVTRLRQLLAYMRVRVRGRARGYAVQCIEVVLWFLTICRNRVTARATPAVTPFCVAVTAP